MKALTTCFAAVVALTLGTSGAANAQDGGRVCTLNTLRGTYVFAATGHNIVGGVPQPKAIIEVIRFNGDGTLTVGAVTVSINGTINQPPPGGGGNYTVDDSCSGTLTFTGGPAFNIVIGAQARTVWMIQTNPNTVFQGTATRVSR
jgi:hypothetical protein